MVKYSSSSTAQKTFRLLPGVVISIGLCAAVSLPALADDQVYHGNFCTPVRADTNKIEHGHQYGVHNVSSSTATVQCPFIHPFTHSSVSVNNVWVTVYDRNPNTNVSCTLYGVALHGERIWQVSASSTGSSSTHRFLQLTPPQNQGVHTMNMTCTIPGISNNNLSHIATYWISRP